MDSPSASAHPQPLARSAPRRARVPAEASYPPQLEKHFVLFAMAGLYLLGLLKLEGVEEGETLGIPRLLIASAFLIFAFSLLPGMFGAPLGELDAYVPPASSSGGIFNTRASTQQVWMKNQYQQALSQARAENKLVLVTFTGYACTNCHWMKA